MYNYCLSLHRLPKYHRQRGSNNRNVLLTVWRLACPRSRHRQGQFHFLCSWLVGGHHRVCSQDPSLDAQRKEALGSTNLITEAPLSWFHLTLITSQRSHLRIPSLWGGFHIWIWGGCKHSACNSFSNKRTYLKSVTLSWPDMDISIVEFWFNTLKHWIQTVLVDFNFWSHSLATWWWNRLKTA